MIVPFDELKWTSNWLNKIGDKATITDYLPDDLGHDFVVLLLFSLGALSLRRLLQYKDDVTKYGLATKEQQC